MLLVEIGRGGGGGGGGAIRRGGGILSRRRRRRGELVLVPVRFDGAKLPIDFRAVHTTDLDGWAEDRQSAALRCAV